MTLDLGGVGLQVYAHRSTFCLPGRDMETSLMSRALDDVAEYQSIAQQLLLVSAETIGGEKTVRRAIERIDPSAAIKANDVLLGDVIDATNGVPGNDRLRHAVVREPWEAS